MSANQIPKVIHYCWFGRGEMSSLSKKCIQSWKKHLPDYKIIEWNEDNFDINSVEYVREAYHEKKFAFVSDYVRLHALLNYGGVYMDTDMEVIKPIDMFLDNKCFISFAEDDCISVGIIASEKGSPTINRVVNSFSNQPFKDNDGELTETIIPKFNRILKENGLEFNNKQQVVNEVIIYPSYYFNPIQVYSFVKKIPKETYAVHHFEGSWLTTAQRNNKIKTKILLSFKKVFIKFFGTKRFNRLKSIILKD